MERRSQAVRFASVVATYRCNAKCHMCNTWQHPTRPEDEISPEVMSRLPFIPTINLTGGEPFLREDVEDVIGVLAERSKRLVVSTNGFWTDRILEVAKKHPKLGVRISLEGLPEANDELRGTRNGFDRGLRTLINLKRMGLKDIGFAITLSDRNALDLMELYHLSRQLGVEFATAAVHNSYYFHKHDNVMEKTGKLTAELDKLIDELLKSRRPKDWFRAYFNRGLQQFILGNPRLLPCRMGWQSFFLDPLGEIRPCNVLEASMGNLKEKNFDEIWNGEAAALVRERTASCKLNCWMIGSAAEPIKANWPRVLKWVLKRMRESAAM